MRPLSAMLGKERDGRGSAAFGFSPEKAGVWLQFASVLAADEPLERLIEEVMRFSFHCQHITNNKLHFAGQSKTHGAVNIFSYLLYNL